MRVEPGDGAGDLVFGQERDVVEGVAADVERLVVDLAGEPVGERGRHRNLDHAAGGEGPGHGGGLDALRADDAHLRGLAPEQRGASAQQSAAAHADHERAEVGKIFEDFQRHRALAGQEHVAQAGVDEGEAVGGAVRLGGDHRRIVVGLAVVERGAEGADARLLHVGRGARHEDGGGDAQRLGGVGHAEPVVAGRRGHHAAALRLGGEGGERVERAAQLERAGDLAILELEVHVAAGGRREGRAQDQGRADGGAGNAPGGAVDVFGAEVGEHGGKVSARHAVTRGRGISSP